MTAEVRELNDDGRLSPREHWDTIYRSARNPYLGPRRTDFIRRRYIALFDSLLPRGEGKRLLEIGAALSRYMVLFRERYGFEVHGLDYSPEGCERTLQGLAEAEFDIGGTMHCRDLFGDLSDLEGRFDVVTSFGVIEHFEDPVPVLGILGSLLRPGGMMLTSIPNTPGLVFSLYRWLDRSIYDMHVRITDEDLARFHGEAGLEVKHCGYLGSFNPGVLTSARKSRRRSFVLRVGGYIRRMAWPVFTKFKWFPESGALSPYIVCLAEKPGVWADPGQAQVADPVD